jgi:hypothetical protein
MAWTGKSSPLSVILYVVLYWREIWCLALMDGHGGESEDGLDQKQNKQQEK